MTDFTINSAVLYRAGIGWFLATGQSDSGSIYFPVAKKDLDDFLKTSLISVQEGSGFKNLSFDTSKKEHLFDFDEAFLGLLEYLRGSECKINYKGETISGKILGYQQLDEKGKQILVSIMNENGIVNLEPENISQITPVDPNLKEKLNEFLAGMVADSDSVEQKMLRIGLNDKGNQEVYVQFLTSVPAWKLSYRLLISDSVSKLQMYAIVDNTTLVDFIDAKLILSTKLPVSFQYDLSTPHLMTRQRIERKSDTGIVVDQKRSSKPKMKRAEMRRSVASSGGEGFGFADDDELDSLISVVSSKPAQFESQAEIEASESVEFELKSPVTIRKNESSMVPLSSITVEANPKHYFNKTNHKIHPFKIIEFKNTQEFAIDEGPISILQESPELPLYQGEAMLGRVPAGDDAIILYALDRDIEIKENLKTRSENIGFQILGYYHRRKRINYRTYQFDVYNNSGEEVDLYLVIQKSSYKFTSDSVNYRDSFDEYRIVTNINAQSVEKFEYEMKYEDYSETKLISYSLKDLDNLIEKMDLSEDENKRIAEVVKYKKTLDKLENDLKDINKKVERLSTRRTQVISSLEVLEEGTSDQKVRSEYVKTLTDIDKELNDFTLKIEETEEKIKSHREKANFFNRRL